MGMTRSRAVEALVGKHKEAFAQCKVFRCACCQLIFPREQMSHIDAYVSRDPVMKTVVPKENIATYVVCQECARLPEKVMLMKVEQFLVSEGLLRKDMKPLDAPGGHAPGHQNQLFPKP